MHRKNKTTASWQSILGSLGVFVLMLSCVSVGVGVDSATGTPSTDADSGAVLIHLENGVVEVQDENGEWTPVSGDSAFDVTAALESIEPWTVAGVTLITNEATQIEEGLQVGDLVRVRGVILEDGTWLAHSIERAEEQVDPIIILIGLVDSVDPWIVNGITLNVTEDTDVQGTI